jgi:hypothetical protein
MRTLKSGLQTKSALNQSGHVPAHDGLDWQYFRGACFHSKNPDRYAAAIGIRVRPACLAIVLSALCLSALQENNGLTRYPVCFAVSLNVTSFSAWTSSLLFSWTPSPFS